MPGGVAQGQGRLCGYTQARCAMKAYGPLHGFLEGRGTPNNLPSLLPGSCHGHHQTFPINPWRKERKEASLRGSDGDEEKPPRRGGLKAVKETSELRHAQPPLSPLLIFFPLALQGISLEALRLASPS